MADNIEYRLIAEEDKEEIHSLFSESLVKDEPIATSLSLDIPEETNDWLRKQVKDCGDMNMSVVAVETTNEQIIGAVLGYVANRGRHTTLAVPSGNASEKIAKYAKFFIELHEDVDIFEVYGRDSYVHLTTLTVEKKHRQRGIASRLVREAISRARNLGYRLFVADVSSNYSTRLFERLEYDVLVVKRYDEFKDDNGDVIFRDTGEHQEAKLVAKFYS